MFLYDHTRGLLHPYFSGALGGAHAHPSGYSLGSRTPSRSSASAHSSYGNL